MRCDNYVTASRYGATPKAKLGGGSLLLLFAVRAARQLAMIHLPTPLPTHPTPPPTHGTTLPRRRRSPARSHPVAASSSAGAGEERLATELRMGDSDDAGDRASITMLPGD